MNNSSNSSKTIRKLLKLGSPIQRLLDSLAGPGEGELMELSGGSNSGKTKAAILLLKEFIDDGVPCSFFDIENGGNSIYANQELQETNVQIFSPMTQSECIDDLKKSFLNSKVVFIDYINLLGDLDYEVMLNFLNESAKTLGIFIVIVTHDRNRNVALHSLFSQLCRYKIESRRSFDYKTIQLKLVKNGLLLDDPQVFNIPV